jgi:hypothetical protein
MHTRIIAIFLILFFLALKTKAQGDNSFKIVASMTGLGAAYEYNPFGILYAEGGFTSTFKSGRFNVQTKMALYNEDNFKIKFGVEGAYLFGNVDIGKIYIDFDRFNNFVFMPFLSFESRVVGLQIPVFVDRSFNYIFPLISITLNVSKDDPAKRVKKEKSKKDFDREIQQREKIRKKQEESE